MKTNGIGWCSYGICFGTVYALQNYTPNISTPNILSIFFLSTPEGLKSGIFYVVDHDYIYIWGGQNYLLPAMDMAKVGGPLSVVKVCTSMLCAKIGYREVGGPLLIVNVFAQKLNIPCPLPTTLVFL